MNLEIWCYIVYAGLTACVTARLIALGREAVLREAEAAKQARNRRAALLAELEMANSDVRAVE